MSLVKWRSRLLSLAPRVVAGDEWLMARTHRCWTLLSLLSHQRVLRVDARRQRLWLRERRWWRTQIRELAFEDIDHIVYRFVPFVTAAFLSVSGGGLSLARGDQLERYVLELVLRSGEVQPLFSFVGEGAVMTGGLGALLGDDWVDLEGTQEEDSRELLRHLTRLTGLGLGPRAAREAAERTGARCPKCNQLNRARGKCLYCGAALEAGAAPAPPPP